MKTTHDNDGLVLWSRTRARRLARFVVVDATLQALRQCREQITPSLGRSCAAFVELRGWNFFGAARLSNHSSEQFNRTSHWVRDLAAIGRGLKNLPGFEGVVTGGEPLGRTTAARLARIATPESFEAWLVLARSMDARRFAEAVSRARSAGSAFPPEDPEVQAEGTGGASNGRREASGGDDDDDFGETGEVRLAVFVPGMLRAGFDDVLDLHRAVSGGHVPVRDFIEALVAEAISGAVPADVECGYYRSGPRRADIERLLARKAKGWSWLDDALRPKEGSREPRSKEARSKVRRPYRRSKADRDLEDSCDRLVADASRVCVRLQTIAGRAGLGKADDLDRQILELLELDDAIERSMGQLLGWISRHRACVENLFNGVGHYAEQRLGMSRREAQMRAAVDRKLSRYPLLRRAYHRGELGLEATAIVLRILCSGPVDRAVEAAWLEHAKRSSLKRLRDEARIAGRAWLETFDDRPPMPADDETWLRSLALFPGTTRRRLRRIVEDARPGHCLVEQGTSLFLRLPGDLADRFRCAIEDRRQRVGQGLASAPAATRLAKLFSARSRPVPTWVGLLAMLEEYVDTWDAPEAMPKRRFDRIYAIWGWRCAAPGCTARCGIEAHHLVYLSQGGPLLELWNMIALCAFHHRQGEHGWLASCHGRAPLGVVWRMGHPRVGRWFMNERELLTEAAQMARGAA